MGLVNYPVPRRGRPSLPVGAVFAGTPTPTPTPTVPGYVATVATAPYAAYGVQAIVSGYSGSLFQLRRSSDNATRDIAQTTGGFPDTTGLAAWTGSDALSFSIWYDQTGNARHMLQATAANQPSFDIAELANNTFPILFDGRNNTGDGIVSKWLGVAGLSVPRQSFTLVDVQAPAPSINVQTHWWMTDSARASTFYASTAATSTTTPGIAFFNGASTVQFGSTTIPRASPDVIVSTIRSTNRGVILRDVSPVSAASLATAQTMTDFVFGQSNNTANARTRRYGAVLYATALSPTDEASVRASLQTAFALPTTYDYTIVYGGDSIMEGVFSNLKNIPWAVNLSATKRVEFFNLGIGGQTLATDYANRVNRYGSLFRAGVPNVAFLQACTNDLNASAVGATLYSGTTTPFVAYLQGLGFKVVVCTCLPRTDAGFSTKQTERAAYNAAVVANTAGADYVLDLTLNPTMGGLTAPNDTTLYQTDKVHPTPLGYRWLAGASSGTYSDNNTYYYALQQVLRTATGNGAYLP